MQKHSTSQLAMHNALLQMSSFWPTFFLLTLFISVLVQKFGSSVTFDSWFQSTAWFLTQLCLWIPAAFYFLFPKPIKSPIKPIPAVTCRLLGYVLLNHGSLSWVLASLVLPHYTFISSLEWYRTFCHVTWLTLAADFAICGIHYTFHRVPFLFALHKIHHEYIYPNALATFYVHPFDHLWINLIPVFVLPLFFPMHPTVVLVWFCLSTFSGVNNHSGSRYAFLPDPSFHDHHHKLFNMNFGVTGLSDVVLCLTDCNASTQRTQD